MKHAKTDEMRALEAERDAALARAKQCDDALVLLHEVQKKHRRILRTIDRVRSRADAHGPRRRGGYAAAKRKQREQTAALLAKFSTTEPRSSRGMNSKTPFATMVRYGYLKPSGNGYVRTAKAFEIDA